MESPMELERRRSSELRHCGGFMVTERSGTSSAIWTIWVRFVVRCLLFAVVCCAVLCCATFPARAACAACPELVDR